MAAELANARIDQLPANGSFTGDDLVPIKNLLTGLTEKVRIQDLTAFGNTTQNFEWVSGHAYLEDEVVTRGGNWYQALEDNEDVTPGSDDTVWELITKSSSGLVFWAAGVFPQDDVFVLSNHKGYIDLYELIDPSRPFVSSNIITEELNEQWQSVIAPRVRKSATLSSGLAVFDFVNDREKLFYGTINEVKTWSLLNDARAIAFSTIINFTTADTQTFPANWKMSDTRKSGNDWTPLFTGVYKIDAMFDGTNWIVEINNEPYV